jgi:hypothetical protein
MIKKLLTIVAFCASASAINAQVNLVAEPAGPLKKQAVVESPYSNTTINANAKTSVASIGDTLWYFLNKHNYRNAPSTGFYTFPSPNTSFVTHFGSNFTNTSPNLAVIGLEAVCSRSNTSPSPSVTVRMYLTNVVSGLPVFPAIDSISAVCSGTAATFIGGNFTTPHFVSGDFAVLYRCASTVAGDVVKVWLNNANDATSTTTVAGCKYGEGFGYLRASSSATTPASFLTTTGAFGAGTDYEFLVAPRVAFTAAAAEASPTGSCTTVAYTFTNNSAPQFSNRQYNLNEFARYWQPFLTTGLAPDSVFTWDFGDATGPMYTVSSMPNIAHTYAAAGTYNGTLTAMYQRMTDVMGVSQYQDAANFSKTMAVCSGVQQLSGVEAVNVYPNPTTGVVNFTNLPSETTIEVVNMLGQSVFTVKTTLGDHSIDLSTLPNGSYFVKMSSANEKTKIVKLIRN